MPGCVCLVERGEDGLGLVAGLDELALGEVLLGVVERFENHALDLLVGEAVAGLYFDLGFLAAALLARRDVQDAVGVDQELYFDARQAGRHRRNPFQVEARQRAAILGQFALALDDVDGDVGLAFDAGGEVLGGGRGDGRVAMNDLGDDAAERLRCRARAASRRAAAFPWWLAEPPPRMLACTAAPRATTSSGFSSVCGFARRTVLFDQLADQRNAGGAADENNFVDLLWR